MNTKELIFPIDKMVGEYKDFIAVWPNFFPKQLCDDLIEKFEEIIQSSTRVIQGSSQFPQKKMGRNDESIILNDFSKDLSNMVNEYLTCCLLRYMEEYSHLKEVKLRSFHVKMQKTPPMGGYHVWHYESMSYEVSNRELSWIIYLNDLPDGEGETEFLYQKRRISPKKGTVLFFPAGMTHVHRGLTVYSQDKYILTGWFHKVQV